MRLTCSPELGRREKGGAWDFSGKEGTSQEDEKEQMLVNGWLLGHAETVGQREEFLPTDFAKFPQSTAPSSKPL